MISHLLALLWLRYVKSILLASNNVSVNHNLFHQKSFDTAICIMTSSTAQKPPEWTNGLSKIKVAIIIITHAADISAISKMSSNVFHLEINANDSAENGFQLSSWVFNRRVSALDKAIFFFCKISPKFKRIWFLEFDVYIPSTKAFLNIHNRWISNDSDLVTASNDEHRFITPRTWHWHKIRPYLKFGKPWYVSMSCAIGMSFRLLSEVQNYVNKYKRMEFLEVFFNTVAMHSNLSVWNPAEFRNLVFRYNYTCEHVLQQPMNWFHPIKNPDEFRDDCLRKHADFQFIS